MKFDFPQVDLPCELLAWNDVTEDILNIYKQSCRLKAGIFAICTEGKMTATINLIDYEIKPNDLITLLPGERTEKVRLCFAGFSSECVERINLIKSMVSSFSKITECPIVELQEDIASYLKDYFSLLARVTCDERFSLPSEMTEVSLKSILTAVGLIYQKYSRKDHNTNRKEEICRELVGLVTEHYACPVLCRQVGNITATPQYHSQTSDRTQRTGCDSLCGHYRRESQIEIDSHDHSGDCLFVELPQCFFFRKVLQEICRHESAGIQKQLTPFVAKRFSPQRPQSIHVDHP